MFLPALPHWIPDVPLRAVHQLQGCHRTFCSPAPLPCLNGIKATMTGPDLTWHSDSPGGKYHGPRLKILPDTRPTSSDLMSHSHNFISMLTVYIQSRSLLQLHIF